MWGSPRAKEARIATVLVVGHCHESRAHITDPLRQQGHLILEATTGAEALTLARVHQPDVVIGDVLAPLDRSQLAAGLRSDAALRSTPLVFCARADSRAGAIKFIQHAGLSIWIAPLEDPRGILESVEMALGRVAHANAGAAPSVPAPRTAEAWRGDDGSSAPNQLGQPDRWRAVFDNSLDPILLADAAGHIVDVNPAASRLLGYSRDELLRLTAFAIARPEDQPVFATVWRRLLCHGHRHGDFTVVRKDGTTRHVVFTCIAHVVPGLQLSVMRDVTERRETERKLRRSELVLAEAQQLAHIGSWNWDILADTVEWSDEHYRIFGMRPRHAPLSFDEVLAAVHPEDRRLVNDAADQALRDYQPFDCCFRTRHPDGTVRSVQSRGRVVLDDTGRPIRMHGMVQDITERTQAEDELRRCVERTCTLARRLRTVEEEERRHIARELHDQVGQLLTGIHVNLEVLQQTVASPKAIEVMRETVALVSETLERVRSLSRDLRPNILDDLGLAAAARSYLDRQAQRAGLATQLSINFVAKDEVSQEVETACFRLLQEAVTNIVRHAGARLIRVELHQTNGDLKLLVADDGVGFDVAVARGRAVKGGSLGLLGMEERTALLGGQIVIRSSPATGTEVQACFPTQPRHPCHMNC